MLPRDPFFALGLVGLSVAGTAAAAAQSSSALTVQPRQAATATQNPAAGAYPLAPDSDVIMTVPPQCTGAKRCPMLVAFPGGGQLASVMTNWAGPVANKYGFLLLAPREEIAYDAGKFDAVLHEVFQRYAIDPEKIAVSGRCASGQAGLGFGINNLHIFSRVAVISGGVPQEEIDPKNKTTEFLIDTGDDGVQGTFAATRALKEAGHPVRHTVTLRGHEHQAEDYEALGRWLAESWAKPAPKTRTTPTVIDPLPLLTPDVITKLTTFWTSFFKAPGSIRLTARRAFIRDVVAQIGQDQAIVPLTDMAAFAAKYPSVAAALTSAGLTGQEHDAIRLALVTAMIARSAGDDVTVDPNSLLGENMAFIGDHADELQALASAGIPDESVLDHYDRTTLDGLLRHLQSFVKTHPGYVPGSKVMRPPLLSPRGGPSRYPLLTSKSDDSLASLLARAGYVAIPLGRTPERHFLYVEARVDTTPVKLLLDSGYDTELMLEPAFLPQLTARRLVVEDGTYSDIYALVKGIRLGPLQLDATNVWFHRHPALEAPENLPGGKGLIGTPLLTRYRAIVDYATDTLYLLPPVADSGKTGRQSSTSAPSLRAALQSAGHYQTFLALMRETGLIALLEDSADPGKLIDSLVWTQLPARAKVLGLDDSRDYHEDRAQQALNRLLRHSGKLTAFIPTDEAFARLPKGALAALRADPARLTRMLRAHLLMDAVLDTAAIRTLVGGVSQLHGATYGFHRRGAVAEVDRLTGLEDGNVLARARIVDPEITAGNGIAHGIDRPLIPLTDPGSIARMLAQQGYVGLPIYRTPNGWPAVRVQADSASRRQALLDTGASCNPPDTTDLSLDLPFLDGSTPVPVSLVLDSVKVGRANAIYYDGEFESDGINGLICIHLLSKYHSRIDFGTGTLYLRLR